MRINRLVLLLFVSGLALLAFSVGAGRHGCSAGYRAVGIPAVLARLVDAAGSGPASTVRPRCTGRRRHRHTDSQAVPPTTAVLADAGSPRPRPPTSTSVVDAARPAGRTPALTRSAPRSSRSSCSPVGCCSWLSVAGAGSDRRGRRRGGSEPPAADDDPSGGESAHARSDPARLRRRILLIGTGACALALIVGVLWIVVTGLLARAQLNQARAEAGELRHALFAGDVDRARAIARDLADHARRAHDLTTGPAWWVGANLPFVGAPLRTGRVISAQADVLGGTVLPGLVHTVGSLRGTSLRHGRTVDLAPITAAAPTLATRREPDGRGGAPDPRLAGRHLALARRRRPPLGARRPRPAVRGADRREQRGARAGADARRRRPAPVLHRLRERGRGARAGRHRRCLRDRDGRSRDDPVHPFRHRRRPRARRLRRRPGRRSSPPGTARTTPPGYSQNSDISPDFRDAARIWAGMWQAKSGEHVDGAIADRPVRARLPARRHRPGAAARRRDGERGRTSSR